MRRYLQGTLDFNCAVYAVINALSVIHNLDLTVGRNILADAMHSLSRRPDLWQAFLRNETDHYWLVDYCLARWCSGGRLGLRCLRPFASDLSAGETPESLLDRARLFRSGGPGNNAHDPRAGAAEAAQEADRVFRAIALHLESPGPRKAVIFRFLRFLPGSPLPVVLHWTTAHKAMGDTIFLHDASAENGAIHAFDRTLLASDSGLPPLYIEPESVTLLERFI